VYGLSASHQGSLLFSSHLRPHSLFFLQKDRSLGSVELKVAELIEESDNNEYPYASTGRKTVVDPIKLDKGGGYKGRLHYTAEFVPALALQGVKFDGGINEVQRAARDGQGDDDGDVVKDDNASSISSSDEDLPRGPTVRRPMGVSDARGHRKLGSEDTAQTDGTKAETAASGSSDSASIVSANGTMKTAEEEPPKGVSLTREELLEHRECGLKWDGVALIGCIVRIRYHCLQRHQRSACEEGPPRGAP
jgi:hypothetical protein